MIRLLLTETITFGVGHTFLRSAHSRVRSRLQPETRRTCAVTASLEELEPQSVDAGDSRSFALNRSSSYGHDDGTAAFGIARRLALGGVATDRLPSALRHLIKGGKPVRGLASVLRATATDEQGVAAAVAGVAAGATEAGDTNKS